MKEEPQNIMEWMMSERLYEEYLFFYILVILFWVAIGFFCFGFEVTGLSAAQNLLLNFILFLLLATLSAFPAFWYDLVFGKNARLNKRTRNIDKKLAEIADEQKREVIKKYLAQDGQLPPRRLQKFALIFLGWCLLFELFLVNAWIKNMHLVWQPDWVNGIIDWVARNTDDLSDKNRTLGFNGKIFLSNIESNDMFLALSSSKDFFKSNFGNAVLFFSFWRAIIFFFVLYALYVLLWSALDWLGLKELDPNNAHTTRKFLYCIMVLFISVVFFVFSGFGILLIDVSHELKIQELLGKESYLRAAYINFMFILLLIGLKIIFYWILFFIKFLRRK
jgi:membrane protein